MFIQYSTESVYRNYWKLFWDLYGSDIATMQSQIFKEESIRDKTCKIYILSQYYLAFELSYMIRLELDRGIHTSESYYETRYGIADKKHKLACNHISLSKIFTIFGIVFTTEVIPVEINYNPDITCTTIFSCEEIVTPTQLDKCTHCTN